MSREALIEIYYFMRLTRALEERTRTLFLQGRTLGDADTAQGHEATTVGAAMMLRDGDCIVPLHRDLGMRLVRGTSPRAVMCQWLARGDSATPGRGGHMHIGDMHQGIVPMTSLLGEFLPLACGVALTMKMRKRATIVLASCGEGATKTGAFHEALNFASMQKLPLVIVIEKNGYAPTSDTGTSVVHNLAERAATYGIPGESVDGNDVLAVMEAVGKAVDYVRSGRGPMLVECKTFRVRGHVAAEQADDVSKELREEWWEKDPLTRFDTYLTQHYGLTTDEKAAVEARVNAMVEDAVRFAEQSPGSDPATVTEHIFAPDGPIAIIGEPGATHPRYVNALDRRTGLPFTTEGQAEEAVGRR
ncbi:MAG TPA: thiamine pyrophosphate-dependent dehydrogenase E1 component subunit alpha [Ktedonobacteraceae bacterium]|nr:thiamine pyrophosphate-dependent dehydrogenase E1 component subunit alpha [Ktedonobacteraceae bacterium]